MSGKSWSVLIVVVALLAAVVWWQQRDRAPHDHAGLIDAPVWPGLDVNAVARLEIRDREGSVTIVRRDKAWQVAELYDYPADFSRLAEFLRTLSRLRVGQVLADGHLLLDELGLDAEQATHIDLRDEHGTRLAELHLGEQRSPSTGADFGAPAGGRYARVGAGPVILVAERLHQARGRPLDWIDQQLLAVPPADLETFHVTLPDETYRLQSPTAGSYVLDPFSEEKETLKTSAAARLTRVLQSLRCSGIADPAADTDAFALDGSYRLEASDRKGFVYTVLTGSTAPNGDRYARIGIRHEPLPPPPREALEAEVTAGLAAQAENNETEDRLRERVEQGIQERLQRHAREQEQRAHEAGERQARLAPWVYTLSRHTAETLRMPRSDLVEERAPEEPEQAPAPVGDG